MHIDKKTIDEEIIPNIVQEPVKDERQKFFSLLDLLPAFVFLLTPDFSIRYANNRFRELFGEYEGRLCHEVLKKKDKPCQGCPVSHVFETKLQERREWSSSDGRIYEVCDTPFYDTDGSLLVMELGVEITERKRAEEDLRVNARKLEESNRELETAMEELNAHKEELGRQNEMLIEAKSFVKLERRRYQELFDFAPDGYVVTDEDGIIKKVNHAATALFGASEDLLLSYPLQSYVAEEDRDDFSVQLNLLKKCTEARKNWEMRLKPRTGSPFPGSITVTIVRSSLSNDDVLRWLIRDISDRKRADDILRESERQLRFLSSRLLHAQEEERKTIARELHDSIGSSLSAIKFGLENTYARMKSGTTDPEFIQNLISVVQHSIDEARRIMTELRPSMLDDLGLLAAIAWFCRQFRTIYTAIHVEDEIRLEESDVPEFLKIVIFRIMQEAFHNISKSSGAELVNLRLARLDRTIELSIEDNGAGFDLEAVLSSTNHERGLGLTSMKERTELSGGAFEIRSVMGEGTMIRATWPID